MLFSEATGRTVLSTSAAETIATVSDFLVDPLTAQVVAIRLKKTHGAGDTLHWADLISFGADNVIVSSPDVFGKATGAAASLDPKTAELVGKRVLTDAGTEIGVVTDVDFDPASGALLSLLSTDEPIHADRLIGCGSYAVIVKD